MGLKDLFQKELTVNEGINLAHTTQGALLLDVRRKEDYKKGHCAGTQNLPLTRIADIEKRCKDKETPIYVIGSYADDPKKAVKEMKKLGYVNARSCGCMEEHYGLLKK